MPTRPLTPDEINALVGTHHPTAGFEYPVNGLQPYYHWLVTSLHLLGQASAGHLQVSRDDATVTTIRVEPGRAMINTTILDAPATTIDLAAFNNDTVYIWLAPSTPPANPVIGHDCQANGWPTTPHLKLAEVTLTAGQITAILDRRFETILRHGLDPQAAAASATYAMAITTAGSTASPTTVTVTLQDLYANPINTPHPLRVRVCDQDGYTDATNATLAPTAGSSTTTLQTITADKDLVLQSDPNGVLTLDVTNATAQTVTLRLGPAPLSSRCGDYTPTLNITHT